MPRTIGESSTGSLIRASGCLISLMVVACNTYLSVRSSLLLRGVKPAKVSTLPDENSRPLCSSSWELSHGRAQGILQGTGFPPFQLHRSATSSAPSKFRSFSLLMKVDGGLTGLAMGAWAYRCGRLWRWRDALFEGPFGRSPGRTELRSQAVTGSCGSPLAEQERPSAFDLPL